MCPLRVSNASSSSGRRSDQHKPLKKPRGTRAPSASEIARNIKHFETWSSHQNMDQVDFSDIPESMKLDVNNVFNVSEKFHSSWVDEDSERHKQLRSFFSPEFAEFLRAAKRQCPNMFSETAKDDLSLCADIHSVFTAWKRLQWMKDSDEKWSEADYVANVYNVFRGPAIKSSAQRVQRAIALPNPPKHRSMSAQTARILNTKTVIPDCSILIPATRIQELSRTAKSPYKRLKQHKTVLKTGSTSNGSSFRYQATPCATLPDTAGFEFASSFWEDKKPGHHMLEDAYRQNRMSTAAAARHLHSLRLDVPVFGLVWAYGTVRAHVDWCKEDESLVVYSAPYPGRTAQRDPTKFEWKLSRECDILQVYLLIRNIDQWTTGRFLDIVTRGVEDFCRFVIEEKGAYTPWRRTGDLVVSSSKKENSSISGTSANSTPAQAHGTSQPKRKT